MDTITSNPTNPLISTSTPVFSDNVQDLLGERTLQLNPTGIIVVNSTADTLDDPNSGVTTLRDAISQANADSGEDLIVFDRSLFSTAQTITLNSGELDITHSLDIIAPLDTLTGGDLVTVSGNNASRVFEIESGVTVTLSGLIVESGSVTNDVGGGIKNSGTLTLDSSLIRDNSVKTESVFSPDDGGGIFSSGNLTVNNSTVEGNSAFSSVENPDPRNPSSVEIGLGGGIRSAGTLTLDNSTITNNLAGEVGGGIYADGTVLVSNSTISGNSAGRNSASLGGGISGGNITVENSTISGNSAGLLGGGIIGNNITVENSTISGNSASQNGGGISGSNITVENSTISGNSALLGGGINSSGTLTVNNSTISGNSASQNGGGISGSNITVENSTISGNSALLSGGINSSGTLTVNNSTISGNSATRNGGGISGGDITVENSTISGNSASQNGGGIYNDYSGTLTLLFATVTQNVAANGGGVYQNDIPPFSTAVRGSNSVRNTIIAANLTTDGGINPDVSGTFTSNGYNLIGDNTGSTGFGVTGDIVGTTDNPIDPLLAPLAFNGGSTQTVALLPGSPAIGAADPTILDTDPITDQRGLPRRAALGSADIGAFEFS